MVEEKTKVAAGVADEAPELEEKARPFQSLEFLVRDWQNFEDEEDSASMLQ